MTVRATGIVMSLALLASSLCAEEERMRYTFENKKAGDSTVPHEIRLDDWAGLNSPLPPKGKEIDTDSYKKITESEDQGSVASTAEGNARAAVLVVFKIEKEVVDVVKSWKGIDLEVTAVAGASGAETGPDLEVEMYRADKKTWAALANDQPEGATHHYAIAGPYAGMADREGRLAFRLSCKAAGKPNRVLLDLVRLALKLEQAGGGLTRVSLPGRCKLTRPDDPIWRFDESDDWFIRLVKGDDAGVDIKVERFNSESVYTFGSQKLGGDNAKGLAEALLDKQLERIQSKTKPKVTKGQLGPHKTVEFAYVGEDKSDNRGLMDIREIFIREKGDTYRISVQGRAQTMKEDRFLVDKVLKSFAFTE